MLELKGISKGFGGVKALSLVSLSVEAGSVSALIGPNGAGKSTLLNAISGIDPPDEGEVIFSGERVNRLSPMAIARRGLSRTFQHLELFGEMTVLENIMVGRNARTKAGFLAAGLRLPSGLREERESLSSSEEILDYIKLGHHRDDLASNLPIGEQRVLEIGRALATGPKLLLLDEPAAGLNMRETRDLGELIKRIRTEKGITILLVEHDMDLVMRISDAITVLNFGEVIARGTPLEIQKDPLVIAAYLGDEAA
ncbi:MAG: ABC transporter ATP-binding protein [Nitrospirae bacterium]|nr:MAG: ABC transporter ATP-binding protein [Nitrospirota bacterium]